VLHWTELLMLIYVHISTLMLNFLLAPWEISANRNENPKYRCSERIFKLFLWKKRNCWCLHAGKIEEQFKKIWEWNLPWTLIYPRKIYRWIARWCFSEPIGRIFELKTSHTTRMFNDLVDTKLNSAITLWAAQEKCARSRGADGGDLLVVGRG